MDKPEPIFVDGLFFDLPRENAPEFVKGSVSIQMDKLVAWAEQQKEHKSERGWLRVDLKKSQQGKYYFQLDTWKPKTVQSEDDKVAAAQEEYNQEHPKTDSPF